MTDFSFQNRAYDLIQLLVDERLEKPVLGIESINDLKLAIDITKDVYPLFCVDVDTTVKMMNDAFNINLNKKQVAEADHILDDEYRPISIKEIKPGIVCKIEGTCYSMPSTEFEEKITYCQEHTFPTKEMSLTEYAKQFDFIWNLAKENRVFVKNTYKYKIGDTVHHINDIHSRGIICDRRTVDDPSVIYEIPWMGDKTNEYSIFWADVSNDTKITFAQWEEECNLQLKETKMNQNINSTRFKRCIAIVSYKKLESRTEYDDYIKDNVTKYWYSEPIEDRVWIGTHCRNIEEYARSLYPKDKISLFKIVRIEPYVPITLDQVGRNMYGDSWKEHIKKIKPIRRKAICRKKSQRIPNRHKKLGERRNPISMQGFRDHSGRMMICVKHVSSGVVSKVSYDSGMALTKRENGNYIICSKTDWRRYIAERNSNSKNTPGTLLYKPGLRENIIDPKAGIVLNRRTRRAILQKVRRGSRLVKEQFVPVLIPATEESCTTAYNDGFPEDIIRYVEKAKTILKRILVYFPPKIWRHGIKLTEEVRQKREERSKIDKAKYNEKNSFKSLDELKEMFKTVERRNDHYSGTEKWSETFERLFILATTGRLVYPEKDIDTQLEKKDVYKWIRIIIKDETGFKWNEEKIDDFIRYLRLTARGVFNGKPKYTPRKPTDKKKCKVKKPKKPVQFEVAQSITKIDYSKLRYNFPEQNKPVIVKVNTDSGEVEETLVFEDNKFWLNGNPVCEIKDVLGWRYPDQDKFEKIIIDTGGGITEVPIKWKRSKIPF